MQKPQRSAAAGRGSGRRTVLLTGATGNWGRHVLAELMKRDDRFDVVALVLPGAAELEALREFENARTLRLIQGDLTDYETVARCVAGADVILHVGAVVSPYADDHPELANRVNIGSMRNIVRAVQALPDPGAVHVVGIGSVAEMGDRNPPHHWGRVGDPLQVSQYDEYGQTKIVAEKILLESGLPHWVWLRQTGIFHPGVLEIRDPIMTHSPFDGVMEWVSVEDASRLLANLCEHDVPDEVWGEVFNIGGGQDWRLTNWELQTRMTGALGVDDVRRWYDRRWFATQNFHGLWYTDSDRLQGLVPFREDTFDGALARAVAKAPRSVRLAGKVPAFIVKNLVMRPLTQRPRGTMAWVRDDDTEHIAAYYGSVEAYHAIGDWQSFWPANPSRVEQYLEHGYDESKTPDEWNRADLAEAASFRGGALVGAADTAVHPRRPVEWRCAEGHGFEASPWTVLRAGHWCPSCVRKPSEYEKQAESNQFLRQLYSSSNVPASLVPEIPHG